MAGTIHVVDDDAVMLETLRRILEASGHEVRTYDRASLFLAEAESATGCVLTDVRMPEMDGLSLQCLLRNKQIHRPVIVMTGQGDIAVAVQAMKAGAIDFLEKPFDISVLIASVERALQEDQRLRGADAARAEAAAKLDTLTPREREVLDLLIGGSPNKEIARELGASPRTIEVHRARIMAKLVARSVADLVRLVLMASPTEAPCSLAS